MCELRVIDTTCGIRAIVQEWDDLWRRSGLWMPTKRAALLAQWIEHFACHARLQVLLVKQNEQLVAALPLVESNRAGMVPVGTLPVNHWSSAGDLLLDPACDVEAALACLVGGVRRLRWPLLWFDCVEVQEPRWQAFCAACRAANLPLYWHVQFNLGLVDVGDDWDSYRRRWSRNLRRDQDRRLRKAHRKGELRLEVHTDLSPDEVPPLVERGLEIEDRSWKGPAGTSVLRSPGMRDYFVEQAVQLADWGQLQLSFLTLSGWPIAFEYGYRDGGTYFAHKGGYDEAYRDLAPGQLLMMLLLERDHHDPQMRLTNCMGMLNAAVAKWCTRVRPIGRLVVGTGGLTGAACVWGYRRVRPIVRQFRSASRGTAEVAQFELECAQTKEPDMASIPV